MRFTEFKLTPNGLSPSLQTAPAAEVIAQLVKFIIEHPPGTVVSTSKDFIRVHEGDNDPASTGLWIVRLRDDEARFFESFIKELTMLTGHTNGHRNYPEHHIERSRLQPRIVMQALQYAVVLTKSDIDPRHAYDYVMARVRSKIPPSRRTVSGARILVQSAPVSERITLSA